MRNKNKQTPEDSEKAHISLKAIWYVMKVYRKTAGKKRFLVTFNKINKQMIEAMVMTMQFVSVSVMRKKNIGSEPSARPIVV